MTVPAVLDSAGRRRSPATLLGFHSGRAPRNKGMLYPADPPTVEEIVCVMRHASEDAHGFRLRAIIVMLARRASRPEGATESMQSSNTSIPRSSGVIHLNRQTRPPSLDTSRRVAAHGRQAFKEMRFEPKRIDELPDGRVLPVVSSRCRAPSSEVNVAVPIHT
jgi:hypothetical protein